MSPRDSYISQQDADLAASATISESVRSSLALIVADLSERALENPALRDALQEVTCWLKNQSESTACLTSSADGEGSGATRQASEDARPDVGRPRHSDVTDSDLSLIAERCRLKAEGARWAVERDELLRDGADFAFDIRPGDQDIIGRARDLPNCFLWMNQPRGDIWSRAENYLLLADCFETLAECIEAIRATTNLEDRSHFLTAVDMMAEAQSALRTAVSRVESHPDSDQQMIYYWLRNRASQERFYISRFMKISDPADPGRNDDVHDRAFELLESISPEQHLATQIERGMAKARHHVDRIASADDVSDAYDWSRAVEAIESLIECGTASDNLELVALVRPYANQLTGRNWPQGFQDLLVAASEQSDDASQSAERAA
ncbi:MAG: hypothetical protein O3B13_08580 [Planctomycetota bacterium]|nr:hypothetical protein [Planctomycetota bacterium]MDA1163142.1 hypothetical protein [Planctomycetota bacterium]